MDVGADFRLLGRLEVVRDRSLVPIPAAKQRVLLAGLLLRANQVVASDTLIAYLWADDPPRTARATLQTYLQRLRRVLGDADRVRTTSPGYLITVADDELDLLRFRAAVNRAGGAADLAEQRGMLRAALGEWRGRPLIDVASDPLEAEHLPLLAEERLRAMERLFDVELRLGNHRAIIRELQEARTEHPLHERFCGQLMLALYRSGRQAEAFAAYQGLAATLADQLGVDPGDELRSVYQAILVESPSAAGPDPQPGAAQDGPRPRELPADIGCFVGREDVADRVREVLGRPPGPPIVLLSGPPGIGKTALAVRVGHELAARFPDGQLYADLRGGGGDVAPVEPTHVLARFLVALGLPAKQLPTALDELLPLYRTTLASRRVLVVLDNAESARQVRPLLPSAPGCAVLVTSRRQLRGLAALQGARPFRLGPLTPAQSRDLIAGIVGECRVAAEPDAASELADLCGHLPLALRIAAANLAGRVESTIASFVAQLRGDRLRSLATADDPESAVLTAFEHCHAELDPAVATTFRLLGLVAGPHCSVDAVAALAGVPRAETARRLDALDVANLVSPYGEARYRLHDLLRLYAREQCATLPADELAPARRRLLTFYLRHVLAAADLLFPVWLRLPLPAAECAPTGTEFDDLDGAIAWMDAECLNITAAVEAVAEQPDEHAPWAWSLAEALRPYLLTRGRYLHEGRIACARALTAAVKVGDERAQAAIHNTLASLWRHDDLARTRDHYVSELACHRACGWIDGQARALIALGNVDHAIGWFDDAVRHVERGLSLAGPHGNRQLRRFGLLNLGFIELHRARLDAAERSMREILAQPMSGGDHISAGEAHGILGGILLVRGLCVQAIAEFGKALDRYRQGSIPLYRATALAQLAQAHLELGGGPHAQAALRHAAESVEVALQSTAREAEVDARLSLSAAHLERGCPREALREAELAMGVCERGEVRRSLASSRLACASAARALSDLPLARRLAELALVASRDAGLRTVEGRTLTELAWLDLAAGRPADAVARAGEAAALHERAGALPAAARALHALGSAEAARHGLDAATAHWARARTLLDRTELGPDAPLAVALRTAAPC